VYDKTLTINAAEIEPQVTWGTNPGMGAPISGATPSFEETEDKNSLERALDYMGLEEKQPITSIEIDHVFIGSCTNARLRDRKSTRLNSSHVSISYAVFCLKKKKK